jgi:hypothetical protein
MQMSGELLLVLVVVPLVLVGMTVVILSVVKTPSRERSERSQRMKRLASRLGMRYFGDPGEKFQDLLPDCRVLNRGSRRGISNVIGDRGRPPGAIVFDYAFSGSERDGQGLFSGALYLVVMVRLPDRHDLPRCCVYKKDWFGGPVGVRGLYRLDYEEDVEFSQGFLVTGRQSEAVRRSLTAPVRQAIRSWEHRGPHPVVETVPGWVIVYVDSETGDAELVEHGLRLVKYAFEVAEAFQDSRLVGERARETGSGDSGGANAER